MWLTTFGVFVAFELVGFASWLLGRGAPETDAAAKASRAVAPLFIIGGFVYLLVALF